MEWRFRWHYRRQRQGISGTQWKTYAFDVVATGLSSRLELADRSGGRSSYGGYIDNVSLVYQDQASAVVAAKACATRKVTLILPMDAGLKKAGTCPASVFLNRKDRIKAWLSRISI